MYHKITEGQAAILRALRANDAGDEDFISEVRHEVFAAAKQAAGIPNDHRVKVEIDNRSHPDYLVLIRKLTGAKYPIVPQTYVVKLTPEVISHLASTFPTIPLPEDAYEAPTADIAGIYADGDYAYIAVQ